MISSAWQSVVATVDRSCWIRALALAMPIVFVAVSSVHAQAPGTAPAEPTTAAAPLPVVETERTVTETPAVMPVQPPLPLVLATQQPALASAPPPDPALPSRVKRMNAWLAKLSSLGEGSHTSAGLSNLLLGGVNTAFGVWIAFDHNSYAGQSDRGLTAGLFIAFGTISLASATYEFASAQNSDELRYARWRSLSSVDAITLARFEGELAGEAAVGRQHRIASGVGSLGLAIGGGALLGLTPFSPMHGDAANVAYIIGAVEVAMGTWMTISSLTGESENERAFRLYQEGKSPEHAAAKIAVSPLLARTGVGMQIAVTL